MGHHEAQPISPDHHRTACHESNMNEINVVLLQGALFLGVEKSACWGLRDSGGVQVRCHGLPASLARNRVGGLAGGVSAPECASVLPQLLRVGLVARRGNLCSSCTCARAPRPRVGRGEILSPRLGGFAGAPSGSRGAAAAPAPALDTHARNPQAIAASPFAAVASALLASAALPSCPTRLLRRRLRLLWRAVAPGRPSAGRWTFAERKKTKKNRFPRRPAD